MSDPGWIVAAALSLVVLVLLFVWWRATTRTARHNRRRQVRAQTGEDRAEHVLQRAGFRVIDRQVTGGFTMWVDEAPVDVRCRADLLVENAAGARFVAEVKTGAHAPDPTHPATRRQLLEYSRAFDVDGILLVDMNREQVLAVSFSAP